MHGFVNGRVALDGEAGHVQVPFTVHVMVQCMSSARAPFLQHGFLSPALSLAAYFVEEMA